MFWKKYTEIFNEISKRNSKGISKGEVIKRMFSNSNEEESEDEKKKVFKCNNFTHDFGPKFDSNNFFDKNIVQKGISILLI